MPPIVLTVKSSCTPDQAFSYVTDPSRFLEWQEDAVAGGGPVGAGARFTVTRRIGRAERTAMSEVTEFNPPWRFASQGIDGPIRTNYDVTIQPGSDEAPALVTVAVDFEGHGIVGRLLAPVVRRLGRRDAAANSRKLAERLARLPLALPRLRFDYPGRS